MTAPRAAPPEDSLVTRLWKYHDSLGEYESDGWIRERSGVFLIDAAATALTAALALANTMARLRKSVREHGFTGETWKRYDETEGAIRTFRDSMKMGEKP